VGVRKLNSVKPGTYAALKGGKKRIVVLRTSGAILGEHPAHISIRNRLI
jgi:hypothetical protein